MGYNVIYFSICFNVITFISYIYYQQNKGGEWAKKNMTFQTNLFKIVAAAIGRENANVWVKKVNVRERDHMVNALVFPPKKEGISTMSSVYEEVLGYERVDYGQSGPFTDGNSASQLKALLTQNCNLQHHELSRNGNQGKKDDTNWDNATMQVFWSDYLHEGGVLPGIGSLPKMDKELDPLNRGKKGKGISNHSQCKALKMASTTKKADGGGGGMKEEEDASKDAAKDDKRTSRAANRAKKKLEADAMPEEESKPAAKENESSGGKKRKATGGGEKKKKKKKKDPNAPKKPRHGKDCV